MSLNKKQVVDNIIGDTTRTAKDKVIEYAASNIALCKYWGKRNVELNLPVTSSLSISMGELGAWTKIELIDAEQDQIFLNKRQMEAHTIFYQRLVEFLDLFRPSKEVCYSIDTRSNIPVGAGLASSACGFAATVKALDALYGWDLSLEKLSILSRLGSGSACRSMYDGFVYWNAGSNADGMDSFATPLDYTWDELRIGILLVDKSQKSITSRDAMQATVETCPFYKLWPNVVHDAISTTEHALAQQDFWALGATAEANALAMHSLMLATTPPIIYSQAATLEYMQMVWRLRAEGIAVFFTQDAGPNLKLLFLNKDKEQLLEHFAMMQVVAPFATVTQPLEQIYD